MRTARGMSLVEVLVVIALIGAMAGLVAMAVGRALPGRQLGNAAKDVAAQLRFTRALAIASGETKVFELDVARKTWSAADRRDGTLPDDIDLDITSAREEMPGEDVAGFRFFPDGASTGGRIVLRHGDAAWRVDIAWLTGEVTLERGDGTP